ncbi:hypothetical protein H0X09_03185 [Candidatus Saccharibacteria bacterium]|nr:hypothetical protein [Candidatus Saccharibacteria bacterium]
MRWLPKARKHLTRRRIKISAILSPVFVVAGILYFSLSAMNSPAVGSVKKINIPNTDPALADVPKDGLFDGKYVSFSYPEGYTDLKQKPTGTYVEIASLGGPGKANKQITVGVSKDSLKNSSGVIFRRQNKDIYKEESEPNNSLVFTSSKNGYERITFIARGDLMASVSVLSPSGYDMKSISDQIIGSLEWK